MGLRRQFLHCMVRSPLWPVRGPNCTGQALCVPTTAVHSCKVRDYYRHAEASASANWPPSSILLWDRKPTSQDRLAKRWMWCRIFCGVCVSLWWHAGMHAVWYYGHLSLILRHAAQFWRLDCEKIADKDNEWLTRRLSAVLHVKVRLKTFNQLSTLNLETANWHVHPASHKTYSVAQHCTGQPSCLLFSPHFSYRGPPWRHLEALPASPTSAWICRLFLTRSRTRRASSSQQVDLPLLGHGVLEQKPGACCLRQQQKAVNSWWARWCKCSFDATTIDHTWGSMSTLRWYSPDKPGVKDHQSFKNPWRAASFSKQAKKQRRWGGKNSQPIAQIKSWVAPGPFAQCLPPPYTSLTNNPSTPTLNGKESQKFSSAILATLMNG